MSEEKIDGIYYETKKIEAGTMATRRVSNEEQTIHYYSKSNDSGEIDLFLVKPDGSTTAIVLESIEPEEFHKRFKDCSTHKCEFQPRTEEDIVKEKAEKSALIGEQHMEQKEFNAAAYEFGQAVKVDETNLKAHLGKGKAHMELGDVDQAKESFEKLSEIDSLYDEENKHIFNEYGIELRKGKMYDLAIENYQKALSIDKDDEALYFNIARAYHGKGEVEGATENLKKALEINPDFQEAKLLYNVLSKETAK